MDFCKEIACLVSCQDGGVTIFEDGSKEIVYADKFYETRYGGSVIGAYADEVYSWLDECPALEVQKVVSWECIDTDAKMYYKFDSSYFEKEGKGYQIHYLTNITEYMSLNRDITKYMAFFKKLSGFQTAVLEKLSTTFYELLPMVADYFKTNKAYFLVQRDGHMDVITYKKVGGQYTNDRISLNGEISKAFDMETKVNISQTAFAPALQEVFALNGATENSEYRMLCKGDVSGQKYALYLSVWPNMDEASMGEAALLSVIKLYLENGIMQEKLRYESEHDALTGLFNKGKYLEMLDSEYQNMESIGIFNFDVNNLKLMNDKYGHEAGDKLLIKAANSIRKVTNDRVHGYRMGGDEYLLIACNVSREEVDSLKLRWEEELKRLNTLEDGIDCVIAVGVVYGEKGYDFSALSKKADELMYEDKKQKKKPGEEIR